MQNMEICLCVFCCCCEWISKSMKYGKLQLTPLLFTLYSIEVGKYLFRPFRGLNSTDFFPLKVPTRWNPNEPLAWLVKRCCSYKRLFPLYKAILRVHLTPDLRLKPNIKYSRKFSFSYRFSLSKSRSTRDSRTACCLCRRAVALRDIWNEKTACSRFPGKTEIEYRNKCEKLWSVYLWRRKIPLLIRAAKPAKLATFWPTLLHYYNIFFIGIFLLNMMDKYAD
jgi:hypothetical protein